MKKVRILIVFSSAELVGKKAPYPWWTEETLEKTSRDLEEAMRKGATNRELRMVKLKRGVNRLCERLGEKPPLPIIYG